MLYAEQNKESTMKKRDVGYYIKSISEILAKRVNEQFRRDGIKLTSSQMRIIFFLEKNAHTEVTQKQIEEFLNVSHPTVVGLISRMEANGFVKCTASSGDKRQKIVTLTMAAHDEKKRIEEERKRTERIILKDFSKEEKREVRRLLEKIHKNLL